MVSIDAEIATAMKYVMLDQLKYNNNSRNVTIPQIFLKLLNS